MSRQEMRCFRLLPLFAGRKADEAILLLGMNPGTTSNRYTSAEAS